MYTLLKPIPVREELLKRNIRIFTASEFMRVFHTSSHATKHFLETQVNNGLFLRLKQGIYTLKTDLPAEEEIANALYKPSYISFEYALSYYHLIPEMPYIITSATTKATRLFNTFSYRKIKREAYTGYSLVVHDGKSFLMADKEKALVDYLYLVALKKIPSNDRLLENLKNIKDLDKTKIKEYAKMYSNKRLNDICLSY